jgi:hypothetical protein
MATEVQTRDVLSAIIKEIFQLYPNHQTDIMNDKEIILSLDTLIQKMSSEANAALIDLGNFGGLHYFIIPYLINGEQFELEVWNTAGKKSQTIFMASYKNRYLIPKQRHLIHQGDFVYRLDFTEDNQLICICKILLIKQENNPMTSVNSPLTLSQIAEKIVSFNDNRKNNIQMTKQELDEVLDTAKIYFADCLRPGHSGINIIKQVNYRDTPGFRHLAKVGVDSTDVYLVDGRIVRIKLVASTEGEKITKLSAQIVFLTKHPEVSYKNKIKETQAIIIV